MTQKRFIKNRILSDIVITIVVSGLFFLLTLPFRNFLSVFNLTEIRPTGAMNPVLGLFFGWPGALGCTIGNFFIDLISGTEIQYCFLYLIPQFAYGIAPYFLWKLFTKKDQDVFKLDTMSKILKFAGTMVLSALIFGLCIWPCVLNFSDPLAFAFFCFLNNTVMCLLLGFPLLIGLNRIYSRIKLEKSEILLLVSFVVELIAIIVVAICFRTFGGYVDLLEVKVLEQIYITSIICIVVIVLVTLILIAFGLNRELNDKRQQLSVAASIQQNMLPSSKTFNDKRFSIYASMKPAKEVGGDFYDYFFLDDNRIAFLIADVSDKGVPSSLFMMRAASSIRAFAKTDLSAAEIFINVNESLCEQNEKNYFVTCWMAFLDLNTGKMEYVNAGHNPFVIKKKNGEVSLVKSKNFMFLGAFDSINYESETIQLEKDDVVFIYTDGVTEANNKKHQLFGTNNMLQAIKDSESDPKLICENVKKSVDEFSSGAPQFDDITMVSVKFLK